MRPLSELIGPNVEAALGVVMSKECKRLDVGLGLVASRGEFRWSAIEAFTRGKRQPKLAELITLAWSFHEDPRDFLDKLLTQMNLPPGTRPVLNR